MENRKYIYYIYFCISAAFLTFFGAFMVFSSSAIANLNQDNSPFTSLISEAVFIFIGGSAFILISRVKIRSILKYIDLLFGIILAVSMLVFTPLGLDITGNRNWLNLGFTTIQPSEFLKLALILWLSYHLQKKGKYINDLKHAIIPGGIGSLAVFFIIMLGGDLGTGLIVILIIAACYTFAGFSLKYLAIAGAGGIGIVSLIFIMGSANRIDRFVAVYGSCEGQEQGYCYQTIHGIYALATGGLTGVGPGASREKWDYLPQAQSDFIFAIIGEEFGVLGTILLLLVYALLLYSIYRIILGLNSRFEKIVSGSIMVWIIGQAMINMAIVVKLLPVIGVPLPLISSGGSSLISTLAALGVIACFARTSLGKRQGVFTFLKRFNKTKMRLVGGV